MEMHLRAMERQWRCYIYIKDDEEALKGNNEALNNDGKLL